MTPPYADYLPPFPLWVCHPKLLSPAPQGFKDMIDRSKSLKALGLKQGGLVRAHSCLSKPRDEIKMAIRPYAARRSCAPLLTPPPRRQVFLRYTVERTPTQTYQPPPPFGALTSRIEPP